MSHIIPLAIPILLTIGLAALAAYYYTSARHQKRQTLAELGGSGGRQQRPGPFLRWAAVYDRSARARPLQNLLEQAGLRLKPSEFRAIQGLAMLLIYLLAVWLLGFPPFLGLLAALNLPIFLPAYLLRQRQSRYRERFERQLPDVAAMLGNSLRAGQTVPQAIRRMGNELPAPAGREFQRIDAALRFGRPLSEAVDDLPRRLPGHGQEHWAIVTKVVYRAGGNLATAMRNLEETLVQQLDTEQEIKTLTAGPRQEALILPLLPVGLLLLLRLMMPEMIEPLFNTRGGLVVLVLYLATQAVGILWIRRLAAIEV
jgi:tight adherence protein B